MRHPLRSAIDLFRSKWWSIGWGVAVLGGGLVFLAVLAERFFGFELGRRQWIGIGLVRSRSVCWAHALAADRLWRSLLDEPELGR